MKKYKESFIACILILVLILVLFALPAMQKDRLKLETVVGEGNYLKDHPLFLLYENEKSPTYAHQVFFDGERENWDIEQGFREKSYQFSQLFPIGNRPERISPDLNGFQIDSHRYLIMPYSYGSEEGQFTYNLIDSHEPSLKKESYQFSHSDLRYEYKNFAVAGDSIYVLLRTFDYENNENNGFTRLTIDKNSGQVLEEKNIQLKDEAMVENLYPDHGSTYVEPEKWVFILDRTADDSYENGPGVVSQYLMIDPVSLEEKITTFEKPLNVYEHIVYQDRIFLQDTEVINDEELGESKVYVYDMDRDQLDIIYTSVSNHQNGLTLSVYQDNLVVVDSNSQKEAVIKGFSMDNFQENYQAVVHMLDPDLVYVSSSN